MDYCCCRFRTDCTQPTEGQQHYSAGSARTAEHEGKKELSNIPSDGQWLWTFNNRSPFDKVDRYIQERKFYATLPHKLDSAIKDYKQKTLHKTPSIESSFLEKGTFGKDGWVIQRTIKLEDDA